MQMTMRDVLFTLVMFGIGLLFGWGIRSDIERGREGKKEKAAHLNREWDDLLRRVPTWTPPPSVSREPPVPVEIMPGEVLLLEEPLDFGASCRDVITAMSDGIAAIPPNKAGIVFVPKGARIVAILHRSEDGLQGREGKAG